MKKFALTLSVILSLVLVGLIGGSVLAQDPPDGDSDSASVNLKVEVVEPEPTPTPSRGVSMFRLENLTVENITENSADILWETSRSTTSELTYWSNPELMIESGEYVKEHLVHLEELKDDTTYYFEVTCRDRYGLKKSAEGEFATLEEEVIIPPEPEEPIPPEPEEPIEFEEPEEEEPIEPVEPIEPIEPEEPEELILPAEEPGRWGLVDSILVGLVLVVLGLDIWQWRKRKQRI